MGVPENRVVLYDTTRVGPGSQPGPVPRRTETPRSRNEPVPESTAAYAHRQSLESHAQHPSSGGCVHSHATGPAHCGAPAQSDNRLTHTEARVELRDRAEWKKPALKATHCVHLRTRHSRNDSCERGGWVSGPRGGSQQRGSLGSLVAVSSSSPRVP